MEKEQKIRVLEGLSIEPESKCIKPYLIGSKCKVCETYTFPKRIICPYCYKEEVAEVALSTKGKLYSYTIIEEEKAAPPGFKVPYALGYIDLPEGVRVLSLITDWKRNQLRLDMDMEMVIEKFLDDPEGNEIYGYKFRPVYNEKNETYMSKIDTNHNENNPPSPPFRKGGMGGFSGEREVCKP